MNQRIKELADEAWVYQVRVLNEPDGSRTYTEKEKVFDKEKFAELIVQECIDIISPYALHMENFDGGHPIDDLKKHFGVEE